MGVILYLSNKLVQVVEARSKGRAVSIGNVWQEEAPEDSIINGIITDEEIFLSWIKNFFEKNKIPKKGVTLIVNSSQFNHKVLELPKLQDEEIKKIIPREFVELRKESTLFSYYILEGDKSSKKQSVLATAVEKKFLLAYINYFKEAGIEISSIDSEVNSLVRLFSNSPEIHKKTCLIQVLDGQEVISMLFVKGKYYYSQKNRLFRQDPMEGLADELESIRGKLFQFMISQQIKEPVETIYLCGIGQTELKMEMAEDKVFSGEKIIFWEKDIQKKKNEFVYPAGCLLGKKQAMPLFKQLKQEQKGQKRQKEIIKLVLPSAIVIVACLLFAVFLGNTYFARMSQLKQLEKSMQEESVDSASYEMASESVSVMESKIKAVEETWEHLMSYPVINSSVEQVLKDCAGNDVSIAIKSFQRDSGVLTMDAEAGDVRNINSFIEKLQEQEIFEAVEYSGYTYISGADKYNIHVVCCMAEGAGR